MQGRRSGRVRECVNRCVGCVIAVPVFVSWEGLGCGLLLKCPKLVVESFGAFVWSSKRCFTGL